MNSALCEFKLQFFFSFLTPVQMLLFFLVNRRSANKPNMELQQIPEEECCRSGGAVGRSYICASKFVGKVQPFSSMHADEWKAPPWRLEWKRRQLLSAAPWFHQQSTPRQRHSAWRQRECREGVRTPDWLRGVKGGVSNEARVVREDEGSLGYPFCQC